MKNEYRLLAAAALAGLGACASPAKPEAMVPESIAITHRHPQAVHVTAEGGKDTNPMWASKVSNEDFVTAIVEAISTSGLFASAVAGPGSEGAPDAYRLEVAILDLDQPAAGFKMTVRMTTSWKLIELATQRVVFQEFVDTPFTATPKDAFAGMKRLRVANEGAARANIEEGLSRLSLADLGLEVAP